MLPVLGVLMLVGVIGATHYHEAEAKHTTHIKPAVAEVHEAREREPVVESDDLPAQPIEPTAVQPEPTKEEKKPASSRLKRVREAQYREYEYYPEAGLAPSEDEVDAE